MATFGRLAQPKSKPVRASTGDDALMGRMGQTRNIAAKTAPASALSRLLDAHVRARRTDTGNGATDDRRQQAVMKVHYHAHVAGKRNGLAGHAADGD